MQLSGDLQSPGGPLPPSLETPAEPPATQADEKSPPALDAAGFAACMAALGPFEDLPFLAVAVSGGPDSLALTLLADRWARQRGGRIVGLTVDHGLRPGAADEARQTGRWLQARAIEHHILAWSGEKPTTGVQQRARDARYGLLAAWCRHQGCLHLLTAHHRRDQAETVAMRMARQSGDAGLAAMPAIRELPGLRLLRPFLGIDKPGLEQSLLAMAQPWLDDPSNHNLRFTRSRLRSTGLDIEALSAEAEQQGLRRRAADRRAALALVRHAIIDPAGFATLDAAGFARLPADLARDVLTRLLMTIGGRPYPPRSQALSRLIASMCGERPDSAGPPSAMTQSSSMTLAHCRLSMHRDRWLICRERRLSAPLPLEPGQRQRWDDRFVIELCGPHQGLVIRALGDRARHGEKILVRKGKPRALPGMVRAGLPAVWRRDDLLAIPHLGLFDTLLAPDDLVLCFCPPSPLANAPFMPHISG